MTSRAESRGVGARFPRRSEARAGGFYALAFTLAALAWGLAVLLATPAHGYDAQDFCRDTLAADRLDCHGAHIRELADCAWTRAFERWVGDDDANRNATECRNDAEERCRECKGAAMECEVMP